MKIEKRSADIFTIIDPPALDPITVFLENFEPGKGRVTIVCYGRAWTSFWGAISGKRIEEFLLTCESDYIADNLDWGRTQIVKRLEKTDRTYLLRIINSVLAALRQLKSEEGENHG